MWELVSIGFLKITLLDLIDIALLTLLIAYLVRLLQNTAAGKVLVWVVGLIGAYFVTEVLGLRAIHWVLDVVVSVWFIAFIVLFQPELRRLLLNLTRSPFLSFLTRTDIRQVITEIVEAAQEMSERHIGALIVIRRNQDIRMTIETGVPIQGKVTKELLLTIFHPRSPLHDGAVVIYNDVIEAAGCILPLSSVAKYRGKTLGTRHRAALGLSEQTDALVIVVSEETGRISLAEAGNLIMDLSRKELENMLLTALLSEPRVVEETQPLAVP